MAEVDEPTEEVKPAWVKPFTLSYVLRLTMRNMQKSINISISETSARLPEFEPGSAKWLEVLSTLNALHTLKKVLDDFVKNNPQIFPKGK